MSSSRVAAPRAESAVSRYPLVTSLGVPVALGFLGAVLSLIGSWNVSLWLDEAATITAARRSTAQLWELVQNIDAVHAAYYYCIHFWGGAFGWSPFSLRLPSALSAGAAVVGVWVLARVLGRRDIAVVAAIVLAVLPRVTWMGVEARSFAPSTATAVWATVALVIAVQSRRRWWFVYAGLIAVGTALNIYVALLVVAHGVSVLALERRRIRVVALWLGAASAGTLIASPVVLASISQRAQLGNHSVVGGTLARQVVVNQWFLGQTPTRGTALSDGFPPWMIAALILAVVGWALIAIGVVTTVRSGDLYPVFTLLPWLFLPTAIVGVYSLAGSSIYNPRYFTFCAPAVALLIALGIGALRRKYWRIVAVGLIVLLAAPIYVSQRQETGKSGTDWSLMADFVAANAESGDGVYFAPLEATTGDRIGRTTRSLAVAYPQAFEGLIDITMRVSPPEDSSLDGLSAPISVSIGRLAGVDRVWVVKRSDYPAGPWAADVEVLNQAGFHAAKRLAGPMDLVVEFSR